MDRKLTSVLFGRRDTSHDISHVSNVIKTWESQNNYSGLLVAFIQKSMPNYRPKCLDFYWPAYGR